MIRIFIKEFNGFLNSLIAYMVIGVFLTAIGLLIWIFPDTSVLDYGFADLDTLFSMGPFVLIFLVPAITMKSFAEERKLGTLELLLTKPLSDWQIVTGKFMAAFALVLVALLPTLIYYFSIYKLGNPVGDIDTPGVIGSYIGLALLGGIFCSIGVFASSLTTNQIVAFIVAAFLCFIFYSGFDSLSTIAGTSGQVLWIRQVGILYHYESMSKGLVDSRDLVYFLSVMVLIVALTRLVLGSRQWQSAPWKQSRRAGDVLAFANVFAAVVLINMVVSDFFFRVDLTDEKRFTIKAPTKKLLGSLEDNVYIEVYLEGDLNPGFRRFRKSVKETLEEFRIYSKNKVHYSFIDPATAAGEKAKNEFMAELAAKGVQGTRVIDTHQGERVEKIVFPGVVISYNGFEKGIMLLKGNRLSQGSQQVLNQSIEGIEFELANGISKLAASGRKRIGLISGHGELDSLRFAGLNNALLESYDVFRVDLPKKKTISNYDALIVAKPTHEFSEQDKFKIDQYLMNGGKILFLVDGMDAVMDSARREEYYAFPYELKLDDQFFKYGARINRDLVQDRVSGKYPVVVNEGNRPEVVPMDWPFYPLVINYAAHPATRNLDATETRFVSSIDTVKATGVKKTPLLLTSPYSRKLGAPVKVDIKDLQNKPKDEDFQGGNIALGYLLEGKFTSLYKNRFAPAGMDSLAIVPESKPAKIIVIADGDIARNEVNPRTGQPLALGFDPATGYTFANENLVMNLVAYLADEEGLINARTKEVRIRPLDKEKIKADRTYWQAVNLLLPLLVLVLFGITKSYLRKRKYASF